MASSPYSTTASIPSNRTISIALLCGGFAIALGLELIAGWLLHNEAMVRILPSSNSVSFNTAVAFVLAGIALTLGQEPWAVVTRRVISWILVVGAAIILYENIFDVALGLDWESLHRAVADGSPRPGRVAPNTCAALILIGLTLNLVDRPATRMRRRFLAFICTSLILLCTSGVFGLMLDPTLMFGWYKFNRMAAPTATGIAVLTAGLFSFYSKQHSSAAADGEELGQRILFTGTILLLAMGVAGGLGTLIIFANYQQKSIERQMQNDLTRQQRLLNSLIRDAYVRTSMVAADPALAGLLKQIQPVGQSAQVREKLMTRLAELKDADSLQLELDTRDGALPIIVGAVGAAASMRLDFASADKGALLWRDNSFVLQTVREISDAGGANIASIKVARALPALTVEYLKRHALGESGEVLLCGSTTNTIACFPSRLHPTPNYLKPRASRASLPIDDALIGNSAIRTAIDYRSKKVVAAYAPLGTTGLGIISKVDAADLYDPINTLLWQSMTVLVTFLVIGVAILRHHIKPVISRLVETQNAAVTSEARAMRGERRLKAITDHLPALIGYIDKAGVYQFANKTYEKWFGRPTTEIIGKTPKDLLAPDLYATAWPTMQAALAGEVVSFDHKTRSTSPNYPEFVSVSYIPEIDADGAVLGFNVLAVDTTDRHYREESLKDLAYTDSLTNLPNRRLFNDRLEQALVRTRRSHELMALMYLDIDHFKKINDTLGHNAGDLLLREFARRLRNATRAADTVARLGGDEFTIIMEGIPSANVATAKAQKILEAISVPFDLERKIINVSTSIGIALFNQGDLDGKRYLQQSDAALYAAKAAGRGRYAVFEAEKHNILS